MPFCLHKCRYCDFYSTPELSLKSRYVAALKREIYSSAEKNLQPRTLFFGGGTPSLLSVSELEEIFTALRDSFDMDELAEVSIECNPGTVSLEKFTSFRQLGFNRISLGVQSLDDAELRFLGRIHSASAALEAIVAARQAGFENVGADMIYSLPAQTFDSVSRTASGLIAAGVSHISAYTLIYEEGTPLFDDLSARLITPNSSDDEADLYLQTAEFLSSHGFRQYEISNFALPGFECLHNLNYWRRGEYFGFGPAAHGFRSGKRYRNVSSTEEYCRRIEHSETYIEEVEEPDKHDAMLETVYLALRAEGIDFEAFRREFDVDLQSRNARLFSMLLSGGYAEEILSHSGAGDASSTAAAAATVRLFRLKSSGYALCDGISRETDF